MDLRMHATERPHGEASRVELLPHADRRYRLRNGGELLRDRLMGVHAKRWPFVEGSGDLVDVKMIHVFMGDEYGIRPIERLILAEHAWIDHEDRTVGLYPDASM